MLGHHDLKVEKMKKQIIFLASLTLFLGSLVFSRHDPGVGAGGLYDVYKIEIEFPVDNIPTGRYQIMLQYRPEGTYSNIDDGWEDGPLLTYDEISEKIDGSIFTDYIYLGNLLLDEGEYEFRVIGASNDLSHETYEIYSDPPDKLKIVEEGDPNFPICIKGHKCGFISSVSLAFAEIYRERGPVEKDLIARIPCVNHLCIFNVDESVFSSFLYRIKIVWSGGFEEKRLGIVND